MKRGLYNKETNLVIRSDNGPQFISNKFQDTCKELKLEHERIPFKTPNKNAHIEAFHRLLNFDILPSNNYTLIFSWNQGPALAGA